MEKGTRLLDEELQTWRKSMVQAIALINSNVSHNIKQIIQSHKRRPWHQRPDRLCRLQGHSHLTRGRGTGNRVSRLGLISTFKG